MLNVLCDCVCLYVADSSLVDVEGFVEMTKKYTQNITHTSHDNKIEKNNTTGGMQEWNHDKVHSELQHNTLYTKTMGMSLKTCSPSP